MHIKLLKVLSIRFSAIIILTLLPLFLKAQTVLLFEDFGNTLPNSCDQGNLANNFTTSAGTWTVTPLGVQDSAANEWYISATQPGLAVGSCAVSGCHVSLIYTDRSLHVGNVSNSPNAQIVCASGDCGALYDAGGFQNAVQTSKRAESPAFSVPGTGVNYIQFNYIESADTPIDIDDVEIYFFDGTAWSAPVGNPVRTATCGSNSNQWQNFTSPLPPGPATTNAKIGFIWHNDNGGQTTGLSFAVDSIIVYNLTPPDAEITVSDTDTCVNSCLDFSTIDAGPGASYDWTFVGGTPGTSSVMNPTGICYSGTGTFTVTLTVTTPAGTDTDNATIVINPCSPPLADFAASDSNFCERTCITFADLSSGGATGWSWSFPGGTPSTSTSPSPPPICYYTPGTYDVTLIAFNQFGSDTLTKTAYLNVNVCPLPIADFSSTVVQTCPQQCVSFTDNSQFGPITSYQWFFPGAIQDTSSSSSPTACYNQEGLYDVHLIVTNQYGSDTIIKYSEVDVEFVQNVFLSPDTEMVFGSSYQLFASGGSTYSWAPATGLDSTNIPNPIASPAVTTIYTVTITDMVGCISVRQVRITVLHENGFFVPNTFSPNGDNRNDYLFVRGNNLFGIRLVIFDRWGEQIFETNDQYIGWDGTYKGKELNPGVYTWVLSINYNDSESSTHTGTVTLVR